MPVVRTVVWRGTQDRSAYQMLMRVIFDPVLVEEFEKVSGGSPPDGAEAADDARSSMATNVLDPARRRAWGTVGGQGHGMPGDVAGRHGRAEG